MASSSVWLCLRLECALGLPVQSFLIRTTLGKGEYNEYRPVISGSERDIVGPAGTALETASITGKAFRSADKRCYEKYELVQETNAVSCQSIWSKIDKVFEVVLAIHTDKPDSTIVKFDLCSADSSKERFSAVLASAVCKFSDILTAGKSKAALRYVNLRMIESSLMTRSSENALKQPLSPELHIASVPESFLCSDIIRSLTPFLRNRVVRSFGFTASPNCLPEGKPNSGQAPPMEDILLATEISFESSLSFSLPKYFIRLGVKRLAKKIEFWDGVYAQVRIANCTFSSPDIAAKHGYQQLSVKIFSASDLSQIQWNTSTESADSMSKKLATFVQSAKSSTFGSKPTSSKHRLSNPFVRVSYIHPARGKVAIGRTKTCSRTADPEFSGYVLESECATISARLASLQFYVPCDLELVVVFEVFHERYEGLSQRQVFIPMMQTQHRLSELFSMRGKSPVAALPLYSVESCSNEVLGLLKIDLASNWTCDSHLFAKSPRTVYPTYPGFFDWSLSSVREYIKRLHDDMKTLSDFILHCAKMSESLDDEYAEDPDDACLKKSTDKKKLFCGSVPTNLHATYFNIAKLSFVPQKVNVIGKQTQVQRAGVADKIGGNILNSNSTRGADKARPVIPVRPNLGGKSKAQSKLNRPRPPPPKPPISNPSAHTLYSPPDRVNRRDPFPKSQDESPTLGLFPFITCGAPAAHCFGFNESLPRLMSRTAELVTKDPSWSPWEPGKLGNNISFAKNTSRFALADISQKLFMRELVVHSQIFSILTTSFLVEFIPRLSGLYVGYELSCNDACNVSNAIVESNTFWLKQIFELGFLMGWESLVSSSGSELSMLEDSVEGLNFLREKVSIFLRPQSSSSEHPTFPGPLGVDIAIEYDEATGVEVLETRRVNILIFLSDDYFFTLDEKGINPAMLSQGIKIIPVLFSQGIDVVQTFANFTSVLGGTSGHVLQSSINNSSTNRLFKYANQYTEWKARISSGEARSDSSRVRNDALCDAINNLEHAVRMSKSSHKDIGILQHAENVVRKLHGCRVTFCKSGKDRTAMSVTLEQEKLIKKWMVDQEPSRFLNVFREYGIRIVVAEKNVGRPKYSFNAAQRKLLPSYYRPPPSTIQDFMTSVKARDS